MLDEETSLVLEDLEPLLGLVVALEGLGMVVRIRGAGGGRRVSELPNSTHLNSTHRTSTQLNSPHRLT